MNLLRRWLSPFRPAPLPSGPHASIKLGIVADELTRSCFEHECRIVDITPSNIEATLTRQRPDLLFVESAWAGHQRTWRYRIAAYPGYPERSNADMVRLVRRARELGIPTVFWNKEDGVHFDRFIDSARLFDVILTVDASCIERYRAIVDANTRVDVLPFAVQPRLHSFTGIDARRDGACFVGSYGHHVHDARRARQNMLLETSAATLGLTVFDRNSDRRGGEYRYPPTPGMRVQSKVPHGRTAEIYKSHLVSLNVNTVEDSETMFSRRLVEILACGGLAVSTPALAIERLFADYCHVVRTREEAQALFERLARDGYSAREREMMRAGAEHVLAHHTYRQRLGTVLDAIGHTGPR